MTSFLAPVVLAASTGILLALPLAPALWELLSKRDAGPLVARKDNGRIENFALGLRARCLPFQSALARCASCNATELLHLPQERILAVGRPGIWQGAGQTDVLVLCAGPLELPDGFQSLEDFYTRGDLYSGRDNLFRALLSEMDVVLGDHTKILRWIHAEGHLKGGHHCDLYGRASAAGSLTLSPGCRFERLHAPVVYSSSGAKALEVRNGAASLPELVRRSEPSRIHGRGHLAPGDRHCGDVIALGPLEIGGGASVFGSVKANGDVHLCEHARIDGSLISTRHIHVAAGCFVKGPVISEREIVIDSGVQVGLPGVPTTVSAPYIRIAPGAVLHGTLWARVEGRVEADLHGAGSSMDINKRQDKIKSFRGWE